MSVLKVVSYNVQEGGDGRVPRIVSVLHQLDADCVALLEADSLVNAEQIALELNMTLVYGEANCPASVAWLSRIPVLSSTNHRVPELAKTLLEIADAMRNGTLSLSEAADGLWRWQMFLDRYLHHGRWPAADWSDFPPTSVRELARPEAPFATPAVRWDG